VHVTVVEKRLHPWHNEPLLPLAVRQLQEHVALGRGNDIDERRGAAVWQRRPPYIEECLQLLRAESLFRCSVHKLAYELELFGGIHGHAPVPQVVLNGRKNFAAGDDQALAEKRAPQQLHARVLQRVFCVENDGRRVAAVRPPVDAHGFREAID
jgi:hypothetical protein